MTKGQKALWFWLIALTIPALSFYLRSQYISDATLNSGIAFSLPLPLAFIYLLAGTVLILLIYSFYKNIHYPFVFLGFGLMVGGGISNLFERVLYSGKVADYWNLFDFTYVNISDVTITLGVMIILSQLSRPYDHT